MAKHKYDQLLTSIQSPNIQENSQRPPITITSITQNATNTTTTNNEEDIQKIIEISDLPAITSYGTAPISQQPQSSSSSSSLIIPTTNAPPLKSMKIGAQKVNRSVSIMGIDTPVQTPVHLEGFESTLTKGLLEQNVSEHCPVNYVLWGTWDFRMGPCIKHIWMPSNYEDDNNSLLPSYNVLCHLLKMTGINTMEPGSDNMNRIFSRIQCVENLETVFISLTYLARRQCLAESEEVTRKRIAVQMQKKAARGRDNSQSERLTADIDLQPHCICFMFPWKYRTLLLNSWFLPIENFMKQRIPYLKIYHEKNRFEAVQLEYTQRIVRLLKMLTEFNTNSLPCTICPSETALAANQMLQYSDKTFLRCCITSHLMTLRHTLVLGPNARAVNHFIRTLGLFLSPQERSISILLPEDSPDNNTNRFFFSDVLVQGMIKPASSTSIALTPWSVLTSRQPLTIIDLSTRMVHQTPPMHEHKVAQRVMHLRCIKALYDSTGHSPLKIVHDNLGMKLADLLMDGHFPETLVESLLNQLSKLQTCQQITQIISFFFNDLRLRALVLINYARANGKLDRGEFFFSERDAKEVLDLKPDGDYNIIMAEAELVQPGITCAVKGTNPMHILDAYNDQLQFL